jgi:prevent-host-death family protein
LFDAMFDGPARTRYIGPMSEHSLLEAEAKLSELIDRALAGEGVVITRDGRPVVELRPVQQEAEAPRNPLTRAEAIAWLTAHRVGTTMPEDDAGTLIRRLRDEGP